MRLRTKTILLWMIGVGITFGVGAIAIHGLEYRRSTQVLHNWSREFDWTYDRISELYGRSLANFAMDYTYWDEMVRFVEQKDLRWFAQNLETGLASFDIQAIWVFAANFSPQHFTHSLQGAPSLVGEIPANVLKAVFGRSRFAHFYYPTRAGLFEIRGASIHPSADNRRETPPRGYLLVGRLWDQPHVDAFSALFQGHGQLHPAGRPWPEEVGGREELRVRRELRGWDGQVVGSLQVYRSSPFMLETLRSIRASQFWNDIFFLLLLAVMIGVLVKLVVSPLRKIASSLAAEDPAPIRDLLTQRSEFGELSRLVERFLRQKQMLSEEIAERERVAQDKERLEGQLRQAAKMEAIGRMASGIAHDFNNMLSVIGGHASLALGQVAGDDPIRPSLSQIQAACHRAGWLTRELLTFSRKQIAEFKVLELNSLIARIQGMLQQVIGEGISIETRLGVESRVRADPAMLEQVLVNLAVNARDAMPSGGRLTIETAVVSGEALGQCVPASERGRAFVRLSVLDTGHGIAGEAVERIFEPFFTTKDPASGTGLGLFVVFGIIRHHEGFIEVDTGPGRGTRMDIFLPLLSQERVSPEESRPPGALRKGWETVLVVEDDVHVNEMLQTMLRSLGYEVLAAHSGEEAIGLAGCHQGAIHLLLTDVKLPGMNGRTLAGHIRSSRPGVLVLFSSGYSENVLGQDGTLDPGLCFLAKPYTLDVLSEKIREVLDSKENRLESRASGANDVKLVL